MKTKMNTVAKAFIGVCTLLLILVSCGKDNYDEPKSVLTGKITYQGKPLGLRSTDEVIQLQLRQPGYELSDEIRIFVAQDGSFSAKLFDGTYTLVTRDQNGPWENTRKIVDVVVNGDTYVEYPVTPYFMLADVKFNLVADNLTASFKVERISNLKNIEFTTIMVSKTRFADTHTNVKRIESSSNLAVGSHLLSLDIKDVKASAKYARIGLKIKDVDQLIYSDVVTIQ